MLGKNIKQSAQFFKLSDTLSCAKREVKDWHKRHSIGTEEIRNAIFHITTLKIGETHLGKQWVILSTVFV